jgi:ATP-dependent DNA helicase RecG
MIEIDLWADEPLVSQKAQAAPVVETPRVEEDIFATEETSETVVTTVEEVTPDLAGKPYFVKLEGDDFVLFSAQSISSPDFQNITGRRDSFVDDLHRYAARATAINVFVLASFLKGERVGGLKEDILEIKRIAGTVDLPTAKLTVDRKHVEIKAPNVKIYRELLQKVNAYPTKSGYRIDISRVLDLEAIAANLDTKLPSITFDKEVLQLNREPIVGFDGTLDSLKLLPVGSLNVISTNSQSWKALKTSQKTLEEKMSEFKVNSLHDLLFWLPRRYIDKSKPQEIRNLLEGESATIVGRIKTSSDMPNGMGVAFEIETEAGESIRVSFFRQNWLRAKFTIGQEVLITGKFSWWMKKPQLNGSSIEHSEEAAVLPIVPVYKQSEAKGITTNLLMAANRELLSRIKTIMLPVYFRQAGRMDYCEALTELHFPTSLERHYEAVDTLAYYELVYMQLIIQETKEKSEVRPGLTQNGSERKLQVKAIRSLPFELTKSQKRAVVEMNKKLANEAPSSTLLNADTGSGKTVVAQLACLRAVEAGHQAVLLGPTDILGRQLFATFEKLVKQLEEQGETIRIAYLGGNMKVREKKPILKAIKDGEIDVVIGTHAVLADSVEYKSLGFVAIDEQQKFGAEQRTKLLNTRSDNRVPDLLMQSATPIPRSTAQVFYGDMDMIELKEKPPGRIPIVTEWIQEDPVEISQQLVNPLWTDLRHEAEQGNQIFVITPMVSESDKIDAASVEKTFKNLKEISLPGLRIAFAHGQMKGDEQKIVMQEFREKKYDVLVASTVVEVGVDIPDATRVVILSADRLGASSLHQIRGRVGRNSKPSKCYLVSLGKTENSQLRLQSLVDSEDGFEIAKVDLAIRGEGKMFSVEQSGRSEMIFASLSKHGDRITEAKDEAKRILKSPFRALALQDGKNKFESDERLF